MREKLQVVLNNGLVLKDPFIIASSHLTDNSQALSHFVKFSPAAITLKTISPKYGGGITSSRGRTFSRLENWNGNFVGFYADGKKEAELLGLSKAHDLIKDAKKILSDTKIGISVLQTEDYENIRDSISDGYDYAELNLKYTLRLSDDRKKHLDEVILDFIEDCRRFCDVFHRVPKFLKISREMDNFLHDFASNDFFQFVAENKLTLLVANSKKLIAPPSFHDFKNENLSNGVVVGDYLYLETYNMISTIRAISNPNQFDISASGGINSIGEIIDLMGLGVNSFQLCTLIQEKQSYALDMLRAQLLACIDHFGCDQLTDLIETLRSKEAHTAAKLKNLNNLFIRKGTIAQKIKHNSISFISTSLCSEAQSYTNMEKPQEEMRHCKIVGTNGNSLAFALMLGLGRSCNKYTINIMPSSDIIKKATYDAAIVSNAYKEKIVEQKADWKHSQIGLANYCLMSTASNLKLIKNIYLFRSVSSENIKVQLQTYDYNFTYITPAQLAPLLIGWKHDAAILVKRPLAECYSYLLGETKNTWTCLKEFPAPIWLLSSPEMHNSILYDIMCIKKNILSNPEAMAENILNCGFDQLLADYLTV